MFTEAGALVLWNLVTPAGEVVGRVQAGQPRFYVNDLLGSVRMTLGTGGNVLKTADYDPWGLAMAGRSHF